jgi:colanic acid biosynthesis glycosyl transferase WcaI
VARFFILTINYKPEPTGFAPKAAALAEHLARQHHDVVVFTGFPFAPHWRRRPEDRGRLLGREREGRLSLYRLTHFIPRRPSSLVQRVAMEGSFSLAAALAMLPLLLRRSTRPDAILYIGAQPALAMLARVVAAVTRRPYFVNITDLAAQAALDVGIASGSIARLLTRFEFAAYRRAAGAGVLTRSFQDALVAHGYPRERIHLERDPTDLETIKPVARDGSFRARYRIPVDAHVLLSAGSMGKKQGLMNLVEAAAMTRDAPICWVLVGAGETLDELVQAVLERGLEDSVRFVPFQPESEVSRMFADADVLVLNQLSAVKDTVIPSKLLTYMAAGQPVLAAVNPTSQAADILREADGGILVAPEDPAALADAARWCSAAPAATLKSFGARNRAYAEQHFDGRRIVAAHERFMLDTLRRIARRASTS